MEILKYPVYKLRFYLNDVSKFDEKDNLSSDQILVTLQLINNCG